MNKRDVIQFFGSNGKAAQALNLTSQAISMWKDPIPEGVAYKVQVLSKGKLRVDPADYPRKVKPA
jgi:hypothetical protein